MLDKTIADAIFAAVDRGFADQVAFTQDLVRFPSVRGAEHTCQDFMAAAMHRRGLAVDQWRINVEELKTFPGFSPVAVSYDKAYNVVGTYRPKSRIGRSLILNGHVDVVPVGPAERWTNPPFEPRIENGWMYGRGAGDMKSGVAAMLYAYDAIRAAGYLPAAPIYFQSVVEEESTGNGTLACVQRGYKADCALIPEPLGPKLLRAQVGLIWFRVHVPGDPQHASGFQTAGGNAIEKAMGIWQYLKELEKDWNARKADHPLYLDHPHPIRFNLGNVSGGEWTSSVPAACTIEVRVGVYPGWRVEDACAELEACVRKATLDDPLLSNTPPTIEYHGHMSHGYVLENAAEQEKALADSHMAVLGGPLEDYITSASSDARSFGLYQDTPALVYGPVCERAHGFDERVDLESVRQTTKTIALFIANWCGLERAS